MQIAVERGAMHTPALHSEQDARPEAEKDPAAQGAQRIDPFCDENDPASTSTSGTSTVTTAVRATPAESRFMQAHTLPGQHT